VEELEVLGELMVDLEHGGDAEQHEEPEVDHRVHHAGRGVAQQGPHVHAGPVALSSRLGVVECGTALGRSPPLPVLHAIGESEGTPRQHERYHGVENHLQRAGHVAEHDAMNRVLVVPVGDHRHDPGDRREQGDPDPEGDRQVMGFETGRGLLMVWAVRRAHGSAQPTVCTAER
jgi:hypothetical protein